MLLPAEHYTALTGATPPATYTAIEARVVALLERLLDRPLVQAERTVQYECWGGELYPAATPVVSVALAETRVGTTPEAWAELTVVEYDDIAVTVSARDGDRVRLTYTGGFAPYGTSNPEPCPQDLAEAIAWGIHTQATAPATAATPDGPDAGIQAMSVAGEYSVTYTAGVLVGADGVALPSDADARWVPLGGRCARLAMPYRNVRVA